MVIIYADVLFLINFILDFLCLYITGALISEKISVWRVCLSAVLGGGYALASPYLNMMPVYASLTVHLSFPLLLVTVAFGFRKRKLLAKWGLFILTSAFTGGLLTGIFSLSGRFYMNDGGFYAEISPILLLITAAVTVLAAYIYGFICRKKLSQSSVNAVITTKHGVFKAKLLVDTGCHVVDPMTGDMVIIVSCNVFGCDMPEATHVIPIKTAGGVSLLEAFVPEDIKVCKRHLACTVAVDNDTNDFAGNDGLIPPELV